MSTLEAWYMVDDVSDQTAENRLEPNQPVTPAELCELGVLHWYLPPTGNYPAKAVPWEPKEGIQDKELAKIRDSRGYNYADIITCSEECLPDYHNKLKAFFEEHIHSDEEVRYILKGSGYFDVRDRKDRWIRIQLSAGDLIVLPEGIYHRFTMDVKNFTQAMRLFKGVPVWTPINRPADSHISRERYLQNFQALEEEQRLRAEIVSCLRTFFTQGWCLGSSGAVASKVYASMSAPALVTPSGVPKEQLETEDLFLVASTGELLKVPTKVSKISDSNAVFQAIFKQRTDVTAVTHIHSVASVLAADKQEVLRVQAQEMIKGLGVPGDGELIVPIIENKATEPELVPEMMSVLSKYPSAPAVLVRDHGAYIFGKNLRQAKIGTECLGFILELEMKRRGRREAVEAPTVVLLDIEGTTTPISFVKDKLFPYAASAVTSWVETAGDDLIEVAKDYEKQCQQDKVPFNAQAPKEEVLRLTKEWIAADRKVPALKDLQGKLWKFGYEKGELKGEMFEDTPDAMAEWVAAGRRVAIFSSGSREAQHLIFKYTEKGDLTGFISAYFDPKSAQASKQESKAYAEIALSMGIEPSEGLFCTDVLGEAQAADQAGWKTVLLTRPGNAPLPAQHGFREANSLLEVLSRKRVRRNGS
eukprot:symbB.v1.2.009351.t1/scaffold561.1/size520142/19